MKKNSIMGLALLLAGLAAFVPGCRHMPAKSPSEFVYRAQAVEPGRIVIDGRMDPGEPWSLATPCSDFISVGDGKPARLKTTFRILWDHKALYLFCEMEDPDIRGTFTKRDQKVFREEAVELFLETTGGQSPDYFELDFSPLGQVFDAMQVTEGAHAGVISSWSPVEMEWAVKVNGTVEMGSDRDAGWMLEARIPFSCFYPGTANPPAHGDAWGFNIGRIERSGNLPEEDWCVARGNTGAFGNVSRFATLVFEEPERFQLVLAEIDNARATPPALPAGWWSLAQSLDEVKVSAPGAGNFQWKQEEKSGTWSSVNPGAGFVCRYFAQDAKWLPDMPGIKQWPEMLLAARPYLGDIPLAVEWQVERCSRVALWYCITPSRKKYLRSGLCDGVILILQDESGKMFMETFIHETQWRRREIQLPPGRPHKLRLVIDSAGTADADQLELRIEGDGGIIAPR